MAVILGVSFGHDASAAIVKDGRLLVAVAKERITRKKKDCGATRALVDYVLEVAGCSYGDIDLVATGAYVKENNGDDLPFILCELNGSSINSFANYARDPSKCVAVFPEQGLHRPMEVYSHQITHAAAAYYTSPFDRAACMSADASGPPAGTSLFAYGFGSYLRHLFCPGIQIGCTYGHFTEWLGLGPQITKAGTLMGLAPYGKVLDSARRYLDEYKKSCFHRRWSPEFQRNNHGLWLVYDELVWSQITGAPPFARNDPKYKDSP